MIKYPDYILYGKPVTIVHKGYYKQKKTSRYGLLNFIYRILYGEEFIFEIETGKIIECGNQLTMNPVTYNNLKEILEKEKVIMSKETFKDTLNKHNLSVNDFLDLRDEWDTLSFSDRKDLIVEEHSTKIELALKEEQKKKENNHE